MIQRVINRLVQSPVPSRRNFLAEMRFKATQSKAAAMRSGVSFDPDISEGSLIPADERDCVVQFDPEALIDTAKFTL